jgi:hypothetical protein
MSTNELPDPRQPGAPDSPGDIPAERPASLDHLDVLIGRWEMEASFEAGYFGPGTPLLPAAADIPPSNGWRAGSS